MRGTRLRGAVIALLVLAVAAVTVPATAYAAVLAAAKASQGFTVLTWKAAAVAPGASASTGSLPVSLTAADKKSRSGIFDVVNSGTSALSGFSMSAATTGLATGATVSFSSCSTAWALAANGKSHTCGGTKTSLGSITGASGTVTVSASLASGARLYVNVIATAPDNTTATSQTIGITVARSQAAAKRNR